LQYNIFFDKTYYLTQQKKAEPEGSVGLVVLFLLFAGFIDTSKFAIVMIPITK